MGNATALIAAGIVCAIGYGWIVHLRDGSRRSRATAGGDSGTSSGGGYSGTSDGFTLGSWFSSDRSGSSTDGGSCSSSDGGSSSGGGDCGGGDGGGGGGGD
ncbi:acidic type I keratin/brefeldin A-inhibited guanine nucleotide-exchange protein [Bradyrhizobium daqingense]|uniref:Acidic type I keratin/brefeldin A-inhibited guanine nucleotide-exchange protein n=2 Tax=Bradyrhizobium daqingense TaxID=993502 RepID=A0A562L9G2_9BRAD|nr:acidic type I keratin/brefeldin A-inhibited guanine nucleotide-exchange protein [Bradyrhizobium daqingense]